MDNEKTAASSSPSIRQGTEKEVGEAQKDPNLVTWDETPRNGKAGPTADPANPQAWSGFKKGLALGVVALSAICVTCASSAVNSAYAGIQQELHVSSDVVVLGVSLYTAGLGLGSILLSPLSEFFGRRPIYLVSFSLYTLLTLPVTFAPHFAIFAAFRFLTGVLGSAFLCIAGGTVADLYAPEQAFMPVEVFSISPYLGRVLGPLISGFVAYNADWRWVFGFLNIWSAVMCAALFFCVPETFAPIILTRRAEQLRRETGNQDLYSAHELVLRKKSLAASICSNSTRVLKLLVLEPMLLLLAVWSALLLGILYLLFAVFPIVFAKHDFNLWQTGLTFTGILAGMLAAFAAMPFFSRLYLKAVDAGGGRAPPEARLPMAMVGSVLAPISLFWFAFTTYKSVHWMVPILASAPFGVTILLIFTSIFSCITDAWTPVAASALGTNVLMRSLFSNLFLLFTPSLYRALGTVGATALLAGLNVLMLPVPFVFYKYGARKRARSRFTQ